MEKEYRINIEIEDEKGIRNGKLNMDFIPEGTGRVQMSIDDPLDKKNVFEIEKISTLIDMVKRLDHVIDKWK